MTRIIFILLVFVGVSGTSYAQSSALNNGQLKKQGDGYVAWLESTQSWVKPKAFWLAYAKENGGLTWGQRQDYPPYEQVKELDKMIIQVKSGDCLMEFFHERWRRANDVRRWDQKFNEVGGCPNVFD